MPGRHSTHRDTDPAPTCLFYEQNMFSDLLHHLKLTPRKENLWLSIPSPLPLVLTPEKTALPDPTLGCIVPGKGQGATFPAARVQLSWVGHGGDS